MSKRIAITVEPDPWEHDYPAPGSAKSPVWSRCRSAKVLLKKCSGADRVALARQEGCVVGFFRYCDCDPHIQASGTWVAPSHRRRGIATRLWKKALANYKKKTPVEVYAVSRAGRGLVRHVQRRTKRELMLT